MSTTTETPTIRFVWPKAGTELDLAPLQGLWTEAQYLKLTDQTNQLIEFTDGVIEVLPMPTRKHQAISLLLLLALLNFVRPRNGAVFYSPLRLQILPGRYREPDLLLLLNKEDPRNQDAYWLGADLVVEIVSPDDPERDTVVKRTDYAEASIPEYWIVNPLDETITVLTLADRQYAEHGIFQRGMLATSLLLDGFSVTVDEVFDTH